MARENQSVKNFGFSLRISPVQFLIASQTRRFGLWISVRLLCDTGLFPFSLVNSGAFFNHIQQQTKNTDKNGFHSSAHHTDSHNFRTLSGFSWHLKMRQTAQQFRPKPSVPKSVQTSSQRVCALQQFRTRSIRLTNSENERSLLPNGFGAKAHFVWSVPKMLPGPKTPLQ